MAKRVIAVALLKGGVGKTTTTVNLAWGLAEKGLRVCMIDCDTQAGLSVYWDVHPRPGYTIAEVLEGKRKPERCLLQVRTGLYMLASDRQSLAGVKAAMDKAPLGALWLRERIAAMDGFDVILLDTAPSWDVLSLSAMLAAEEVVCPVSTEYLSMASIAEHIKTIDDLRKYNPRLHIVAIVPTFVDGRTKRSLAFLDLLQRTFGELVTPAIRINSDLSAAAAAHDSIFEHAPHSRGADDYRALVERIYNATT